MRASTHFFQSFCRFTSPHFQSAASQLMRNKEAKAIQDWVSHSSANGSAVASAYGSDDEMAPDAASRSTANWSVPHHEEDWDSFVDAVGGELRSGKTKRRMQVLQGPLMTAAADKELASAQKVKLLGLLLSAAGSSIDRSSRRAILEVAGALILSDEAAASIDKSPALVLKSLIGWLKKETDAQCKPTAWGGMSTSLSSRVLLLAWSCATYRAAVRSGEVDVITPSPYWSPLVGSFAAAFDAVLYGGGKDAAVKNSLVLTRRTIRENHIFIPALIETLTSASSARTISLLGLVVDVALRLRVGGERSKGSQGGVGQTYIADAKDKVLSFYVTQVLSSKIALPPHALTALAHFVRAYVTSEKITNTARPVLEKMLLRSPEISLPAATALFHAFNEPTDSALAGLLNSILAASRSSAPLTRAKAVDLFRVLVSKVGSPQTHANVTKELVMTLKSAKTSTSDHRGAIFDMMSVLSGSIEVSPPILDVVPATLAKESQESAMQAAMKALEVHIGWALQNGHTVPAAAAQAIGKEMQNAKPPLRKAVCDAVGSLLWALPNNPTSLPASTIAFVDAIVPGLEVNLNAASTNTLTSSFGPLEGYVAIALLEGRLAFRGSAKVDALLQKNEVIAPLLSVAPKPSFLLNDKVFRKFSAGPEDIWLIRALQSFIVRRSEAIDSAPQVVSAIGAAVVHCALQGATAAARKEALVAVEAAAQVRPRLIARIVRQGLSAWLHNSASAKPVAVATGDEEISAPRNHSRQIAQLLRAASAIKKDALDEAARQDVLIDSIILAHDYALQDPHRQCFIDLCKQASIDPRELVEARLVTLLERIASARQTGTQSERQAAFAAVSTLAFVAPSVTLARLVPLIEANLDTDEAAHFTANDLGMWSTPADRAFVDVLSIKKDVVVDKNRKDAKIEQWEAELRESIAKKKAAENKTLTKDQKIAVDAQLKVEAEVRKRVNDVQARLVDALQMVVSLIDARTGELDAYLPTLVERMLPVFRSNNALRLAGRHANSAFTKVSSCASTRLGEFKDLIGVALLRTVNEDLTADDFRAESRAEMLVRVLYRLRFVSEQSPLDIPTVALAAPLVSSIIEQGGIGIDKGDSEVVLEQIQLGLDFIVFHGEACQDQRYPRSRFIADLVTVVSKHTQLAKDAVSGLRALGEAMRATATSIEIQNLFKHLYADEVYVRAGCLQALQPLDLTEFDFPTELWLACHDTDEENARLALIAWEDNGLDVPESFPQTLVPLLEHPHAYVRQACSLALAESVRQHPDSVSGLIAEIAALYRLRNKVLAPEYDRFGMVVEATLNREDPWKARAAIATSLIELGPLFKKEDVKPFFEFLINESALGDRHDEVRQRMLDAGSAVIDSYGAECLTELIHMFESFLGAPTPATDANDGVTEAVVILFGRLARHLAADDKRVLQVVNRLVDALETPSELVQSAVADCLPPLVDVISSEVPRLVEKLMKQLLQGAKYAHRRGAAYGLAGIVQGRGISTFAEFRIMPRLADAIEDKKSNESRQGALFAYETFTATLRRLFEPYIHDILPQLLACFGDTSADVREATQDTARVIMQNISGYCVKLILPTLLTGVEEKQWRTKKGAIELLGAMAYCAPRQLSIALPTVIPRLSDVLTDSHAQVRSSANKSLKNFGEVIENPEIKKLTPKLLQALIDPNKKTSSALTSLLETSFVHYIDSPSLALIMPIIDRGLRERSAQISKDSAQIVGNLAGLTDSKDFTPYLTKLVPLVKLVLVSPVPEARAVAAKALGTLVERLGEVNFVDLVPSLLQVLRTDSTGVDRQGSAQGLAEILAGLGVERMEALLPEIINSASSSRPYVREGNISLLIYLPATFGHRFIPHLGRIIPPILGGIADDVESVREASMRAGRMIIANYSSKAVDLLLPELEKGMFDENWRIRMSSIQLVADLLFRLCGISGKNEVEEGEMGEETAVANNSVQRALVEALGEERRDRILAGIYIVRQDPNIPVRQASIHTWKALVFNTPRTAREILSTMLDMLINLLASPGEEQREMAGRTLGELVRKLGEKILRETIPLLRSRGVTSDDVKTRSGVCFAITEVLQSATKTQLEDHEDSVIAIIRHALVDESSVVRHAAAQAFDAAQQYIGPSAIDETIPTLLGALKDPDSGSSKTALAALREVMRARADVVFPVLVPTLTAQPISAFNAVALAALARVAGAALNRRLSSILSALAKSLDVEQNADTRHELNEAVSATVGSLADVDGVHQLMVFLLGWAGTSEDPKRRKSGCAFFKVFCTVKKASVDLDDYHVDWIRKLVPLFDDPVPEVAEAAWEALDALIKTVPKDELEGLVVPLRRAVESASAPGRHLPGFCRPKGVGPLVPVFLAGLMNGTAEQREQGALGLGDLVERTSPEAIKPFVTQLVGPLIRSCGDRHAPAVKAAIISALTAMLVCIPAHCRPFYPQLQRSFQKAVSEPASINVRSRAAIALGTLMALQTRVDPVILELAQTVRNGFVPADGGAAAAAGGATGSGADAAELAESAAYALSLVLTRAPAKNIGAGVKETLRTLLVDAFDEPPRRESSKKALAPVVAALLVVDSSADTVDDGAGTVSTHGFIKERVVSGPPEDATMCSMCVAEIMENEQAAKALWDLGSSTRLKAARLVGGWIGDAPQIARPAREARDAMRQSEGWKDDQSVLDLL